MTKVSMGRSKSFTRPAVEVFDDEANHGDLVYADSDDIHNIGIRNAADSALTLEDVYMRIPSSRHNLDGGLHGLRGRLLSRKGTLDLARQTATDMPQDSVPSATYIPHYSLENRMNYQNLTLLDLLNTMGSQGSGVSDIAESDASGGPRSAFLEGDWTNSPCGESPNSEDSLDGENEAIDLMWEDDIDRRMRAEFQDSEQNPAATDTDNSSDDTQALYDQDVLRPTDWIKGLQRAEIFVLERSYLWFSQLSAQTSYMFSSLFEHPELGSPRAPRSMTQETYYLRCQLPVDCHSRGLTAQWRSFLSLDNSLLHALPIHEKYHEQEGSSRGRSPKETPKIEYERSASPLHDCGQDISEPTVEYQGCTAGSALCSLLNSRNVLISLYETIENLQREKICGDGFSFFVQHEPQTVFLRRIRCRELASLIEHLNDTIAGVVSRMVRYDGECLEFRLMYKMDDSLPFGSFLNAQSFTVTTNKYTLDAIDDFWSAICRILDLGLISYCGAHVISATENYSALDRYSRGRNILIPRSPYEIARRSLRCLQTFLKGEIWVVRRIIDADASAASVLTCIDDLADIWGPIWKLTKSEDATSEPMGFYAIGGGAIGAPIGQMSNPNPGSLGMDAQSCHFTPYISRREQTMKPMVLDDTARLLIGTRMITPDFEINQCHNSQRNALQDVEIRPHGTSEASTYKDSMTFGIQAGYQGINIIASSQYKLRHAVTRKQRLQTRWMLQPEKCSLKNLNLWVGLEVSACTRNARRRRLSHLLTSRTIRECIQSRNFPWSSPGAEEAFLKYCGKEDLGELTAMTNASEDYQKDIKRLTSWCLELLVDTGVGAKGDLSVFAYMGNTDDPDKTAVLSKKRHSWVGFLKDTVQTATFAIATDLCLSFPYERFPGQCCRSSGNHTPKFSVLQTAIVSRGFCDRRRNAGENGLLRGQYLPLNPSKTEMLKVLSHLPNGNIVVRWSTAELARSLAFSVVNGAGALRYDEQIEEDDNARRTAVKVYVISKYENKLPRGKGCDRDQGQEIESYERPGLHYEKEVCIHYEKEVCSLQLRKLQHEGNT